MMSIREIKEGGINLIEIEVEIIDVEIIEIIEKIMAEIIEKIEKIGKIEKIILLHAGGKEEKMRVGLLLERLLILLFIKNVKLCGML
jgi:hypothetical protein